MDSVIGRYMDNGGEQKDCWLELNEMAGLTLEARDKSFWNKDELFSALWGKQLLSRG